MRILLIITFLLASLNAAKADGWRSGEPVSQAELFMMFASWDEQGWSLLHTSKDEWGVVHSVFVSYSEGSRSCFLTPSRVFDLGDWQEVVEMECFDVRIVNKQKKSTP